ncbi:Anaphase-promoting complex subunit 4 [Mortierella sp. GBA30]|nr:Anaphase-promoting complex subunit 4 [Mortierella sp. GBA30]
MSAVYEPMDRREQRESEARQTATAYFHPTFNIYSEKQLPTGHKLEAWCPTADLIAIVNHKNELELYRLSWQRHWAVAVKSPSHTNVGPGRHQGFSAGSTGALQQIRGSGNTTGADKADIVSIAWRPDGKMIAVGLNNGCVNVYDYRDGSLAYTISPPEQRQIPQGDAFAKASARCLRWADIYLGQSDQTPLFGTRHTPKTILEALPLLSPIPPSSTQQQMMKARSMFKNNIQGMLGASGAGGVKSGTSSAESVHVPDEESSDVMNVLFVGDDQGRFTLRLFGGFETNRVFLPELLEAYGSRDCSKLDIVKADIQLDLSEIVLIALESNQPPTSSGDKDAVHKRLLQISISSDLLYNHAREIRVLGLTKRPVDHLLDYLGEAFQVMKTEHKKISQLAENCVESVQQSLTDNGGEILS